MIVLALLSLTGCEAFQKARDTLDGVLQPVVVEGLVLGIQAPQGTGADDLFQDSPYAAGTAVTAFLADAQEVADLENAPITDAEVVVDVGDATFDIPALGEGGYSRVPDGAMVYDAGQTWSLSITRTADGESSTGVASLALPADHDFSEQLPMFHTAGEAIDLDFTGLDYDAALVVVLDQDGVAYSNEPTTIREVYEFTHGNGDLTTETLPGEVFTEGGIFLVGVAGMTNTRAADLEGVNTALSTVMMGKMRFYAVSTFPPGG